MLFLLLLIPSITSVIVDETRIKEFKWRGPPVIDETVLTNPNSFDYDFTDDLKKPADLEDIYDQNVGQLPRFNVYHLGHDEGFTKIPIVTRRWPTWSTVANTRGPLAFFATSPTPVKPVFVTTDAPITTRRATILSTTTHRPQTTTQKTTTTTEPPTTTTHRSTTTTRRTTATTATTTSKTTTTAQQPTTETTARVQFFQREKLQKHFLTENPEFRAKIEIPIDVSEREVRKEDSHFEAYVHRLGGEDTLRVHQPPPVFKSGRGPIWRKGGRIEFDDSTTTRETSTQSTTTSVFRRRPFGIIPGLVRNFSGTPRNSHRSWTTIASPTTTTTEATTSITHRPTTTTASAIAFRQLATTRSLGRSRPSQTAPIQSQPSAHIQPAPKPIVIHHGATKYRGPTYNCRVLNPFDDGIASSEHDQSCQMLYPGMSSDGNCRCFYKVSQRDEHGCAMGFLYACRPLNRHSVVV